MNNEKEKTYTIQLNESEVDLLVNWICYYIGQGEAGKEDDKLYQKIDDQLAEQQNKYENVN